MGLPCVEGRAHLSSAHWLRVPGRRLLQHPGFLPAPWNEEYRLDEHRAHPRDHSALIIGGGVTSVLTDSAWLGYKSGFHGPLWR